MRLARQWFAFTLVCGFQVLGASIDGRVVNSATNEALGEQTVRLTCLADTSIRRYHCDNEIVKTKLDGSFHFQPPVAAMYRLSVTPSAGLVATRLSQAEVAIDWRSSLTDIVLRVSPESTITGKVFDESGEPKAAVAVEAWRVFSFGPQKELRIAAKALTDEKGNYTLRSLIAGNYYVATALKHADKNDSAPFLFYAPATASLERASLTHVDAGQNYSDVEIHLRPAVYFKIQGRAQMETVSSVSGDTPRLHLAARDNSGVSLPPREIQLARDGSFETEVLPGAYTLLLTGVQLISQTTNPSRPAPSVVRLLARQDIEVSAKDLLGMVVIIPPPIAITGHAILDGPTETPVAKGRVMLRPMDSFAQGGQLTADLQPDGTFGFTNCEPVNYVVRFLPPAGTYTKSIVFNQQDVTTQPVDLSKGSGGDLTITIRPGPASLSGTVSGVSSNSDASGTQTAYNIVLIPDPWVPNGIAPVRRVSSRAGEFDAAGLPPGHYTVVATTGFDSRLWETPAFVSEMQSRGATVELGENDKKNLAVPVVTFDEIDQIRSRLGLD